MISVVIVGTGNVAQNLFHAFQKSADVNVKQVIGRNKEHLAFVKDDALISTEFTSDITADVYILAISDDAISTVAEYFKDVDGLLVHTSGATSVKALKSVLRPGIFYPLQTFTKGKIISFDDIPMCVEATNENDLNLLKQLGNALSNTVVEINSEQRKALHIAAVFVNNFTNYMYTMGSDICVEHNLDFSLLQPLIKETAAKLDALTPLQAQTGPAKRGDQQTLHNHLQIIKDKHQRELYTLLSNAIKEKHGKEL
ncbi:putative short-subunit dehydrogenase-like oxidoreductase (DUF2520 family) [Maribacter caenipelagi]|uniref:Putative short-subunit dehydrogenase-like oxidoreductase (DUF2520 family) n=1 Tax=Maribacter caenipelagi TaxID=1447781 RepID=A0A4V6Q061_9FLAO|nr:Rossmann-like and DUF2520 domain-containing protein [Maribacter caenipelagi]TDS20838.1 putative short-subunit dehydrogenase-like oxidoreductase (DUF2520 family) [Maribacter caenipelagi]